ncbi:MAG: helix-turn-helix transcriptional regulator [Clostridia bacterium]|nr:helix-turn-helix transcriptional regulator [Clostridia bacterium]
MSDYKCSCNVIHDEAVRDSKSKMLDVEMNEEMAAFFKVLGDPTRMKIVNALIEAEELCVCDIASILEVTQSATSHQLRVLKQGRFVKSRRDGKVVYYSIDDFHIAAIFNTAKEHLIHRK